jgi:hypothetical protein
MCIGDVADECDNNCPAGFACIASRNVDPKICIPNAITCATENGLFTGFCPADGPDNVELFCSAIKTVFDKKVIPVCSPICNLNNAIGVGYQCPSGSAVAPTTLITEEEIGTVCLRTLDEPDRLTVT